MYDTLADHLNVTFQSNVCTFPVSIDLEHILGTASYLDFFKLDINGGGHEAIISAVVQLVFKSLSFKGKFYETSFCAYLNRLLMYCIYRLPTHLFHPPNFLRCLFLNRQDEVTIVHSIISFEGISDFMAQVRNSVSQMPLNITYGLMYLNRHLRLVLLHH